MADNDTEEESFFSFTAFDGLEIVVDNARSHAPLITSDASSQGSSSEDEEMMAHHHQPLSPARGLTRWGSQEDLISNIVPKPPSRPSTDSPIPTTCTTNTDNQTSDEENSSCLREPPSNRDTRIHRIRSRWNSHISADENTKAATSKISPTLPRRLKDMEDIMMPPLPDMTMTKPPSRPKEENDDDSDDLIMSQSEGTLWKGIMRQQQQRQHASAAVAQRHQDHLLLPVLSSDDSCDDAGKSSDHSPQVAMPDADE
ncbi:expressed unknown protein [Seminavis robusta]|uniref:Uncharacterized protein n=1 Tax=Seminavis robusta TaxID=568900 RepID=A0A9N8HNG3_9STRA|nr:expressed unknown protein [Seminavis robusta]|eukprot:Sro1209_g252640.1 n/a (256) ;mRNA; f:11175-11942